MLRLMIGRISGSSGGWGEMLSERTAAGLTLLPLSQYSSGIGLSRPLGTLMDIARGKPATTLAQFAGQTVALAKSDFGAAAARKIQSAWSDVGIKA
jgi:hypothetical protein